MVVGRGLGHGDVWLNISFAVERSVKSLLGLEVDLLRKSCLVTKVELEQGPLLNVGVGKWDFEVEEIAELASVYGTGVRREARRDLEFIEWARDWTTARS